MSFLDELFEDLKDDLEKVKQEEEQIKPGATSAKVNASSNGNRGNVESQIVKSSGAPPKRVETAATEQAPKKPRIMPTQVIMKKDVVVSAAAPTLNKEYLNEMLGLDARVGKTPPPPTLTHAPHPTFVPRSVASETRAPASISLPKATEELVFKSASTQKQPKPGSKASADAQQPKQQQQYGLFIGNLGQETRDDHLMRTFKEYPSLTFVRTIMENPEKCKGYGFVYFSDPFEMLKAMREKNGKLCGIRPMIINKAKAGSEQDHKDKKH